jgi:hypothetical protein
MKESPLGFSYSWADTKPIRTLALIVLGAQLTGSATGLLFPRFPNWFESLWFGGAVAAFPGFVMGLVVQAILRPGSIRENRVMVRRFALVALALSAFALAMPILGFGIRR